MRHEPVGRAFGLHFVGVLPNASASPCAKTFAISMSWCSTERVEGLRKGDEVARNQPRALVDQLIERVLAVRARLAPVDRARVDADTARRRASRACRCSPSSAAADTPGSASGTARTAAPRRFARRRSCCSRPPDSAISTGRLRSNGRGAEVLVHLVEAGEHRAEVVGADREHRREADRRIHRVAAADPVPEAEHVGGVDAELRHLRRRWSTPRRSASPPTPHRRRARAAPTRARCARSSSSRAS